MGEAGLVIKTDADMLTVSLKRSEACSKCKACIAGMNENEMVINAKNLCGATVGDTVEIELSSVNFIKAVLISYGIPCIFFVAGVFIGNYFISEIAGFLTGLFFVVCVYFFISKNKHRFEKDEYTPLAVKRTVLKQ
ncbi:MAG: SoxR reducing system RseC family protein [Clostridiales bacterium]|jgi:sigma-E factor negative regulatory protein RseC|nr:SoxR reducing system RseC family protein [Clostridiales bacterium]